MIRRPGADYIQDEAREQLDDDDDDDDDDDEEEEDDEDELE